MIFVGEYDYSVDPQGRISLPGEWRSDGESSWIALPENDSALILMSESALLAFFAELQKLSVADPALRLTAARLGSLAPVTGRDVFRWRSPSWSRSGSVKI